MYTGGINATPDGTQNYRNLVLAKITSVNTPSSGPLQGRPVYEWVEQTFNPDDGKPKDPDDVGPRKGVYTSATQFDNCIIDPNDAQFTVGQFVWVKMKGAVTGITVYESIAGAGSGGFEARLTSRWSTSTGYSWTKLALKKTPAPPHFQLPSPPVNGFNAVSFIEDTTLNIGTEGLMVPYDEGYIFVHKSSSGDANDCSSCSWLADVPTDDDTLRPDMLIQLRGGAGRCSCIPREGDNDPDEGTRAKWDAETTSWKSYKGISTCCGCADATFAITDSAALTATLTLNNFQSCQDGGSGSGSGSGSSGSCGASVSLALTQECCGTDKLGRPFVEFFGKGPDPCSGPRSSCDNTFHVRVICIPAACLDGKVTCSACVEGEGPGAWEINATGFTNCCAAYNGRWRAVGTGDCSWAASCGSISVSVSASCLDLTITFSGAACGTVTYNAHSGDDFGLHCFENKTASLVSGGGTDAPATVTVKPLACQAPCGSGLYVSSSGPLPCSTCDGTPPVTWASQVMSVYGGYLTASLGGGSTEPCMCDGIEGYNSCHGFGVIVRCNGDGTFDVGPYCASQVGCDTSLACYAGPPTVMTVANEAVAPAVLFTVTFTVDDPKCSEGSTSVTLTFSSSP